MLRPLKLSLYPTLFLFFLSCSLVHAQTKRFEFTGKVQTFVVPNGIYQLQIEAYGASGGWNDYSGIKYDKYLPGKGGSVKTSLPVQPGQILNIYVGEKGKDATHGNGGQGGFNGGGNGNTSNVYSGGGGGGATDIRINGIELSNRVIVAGGGGGAAYNYADGGDNGGNGGGLEGENGYSKFLQTDNSIGKGGTQHEGGEGGQWPSYTKAENGTLGIGGNGPSGTCGTGGGGGYYGGGGGCWAGGGGGSSYTDKRATQTIHEQGVNEGDGYLIITFGYAPLQTNCINPVVNVGSSISICEGESILLSAKSNYNAEILWNNGIQNNVRFFPPVGKTEYTVTSSSKKECSYTITVNVSPSSLKATTTNGIICEGESTTLIGFGSTNNDYLWSNGVQNNVPFTPPVGVNNYTVKTSSMNGNDCSNEASVFVVVNKVEVNGEVKTNQSNSSIEISASGGTYPYSYYWKYNGMELSRSEDIQQASPGKYEVLVVDAIGCSSTQEFYIPGTLTSTTNYFLEAVVSSDQSVLHVSYPGTFNYKITDEFGKTILTGQVLNLGDIDISQFSSGRYRICSLYGDSNDNVNFTKW